MLGAGQENIKLRGYEAAGGISPVGVYTWDVGSLSWIKQAPITSGGGGGAVTIADGADVAEGTRADAAYSSGSGTVISILKGIFGKFPLSLGQKGSSGSFAVVIASDQSTLNVQSAAEGTTSDAAYVSGAGTVVSILKGIFGKLLSAGQKTMAASAPVVIASDQSSIPTTVGNFPVTQPVTIIDGGNVALGSTLDSAYSVGAGTVISLLKGIFGKFGTLGQKTMAGSAPVVIASDQSSIPTTVGNFPATQTVAGTVAVSNFPANQTISGTVSVSNFPANQQVNGLVAVSNFPATQTVAGAVTVAVATAAAPSYAEGTPVNLSTDLAGNLRISGTISASTSADVTQNDAEYTAGQTGKNLTQSPDGRLRVNAQTVDDYNNKLNESETRDILLLMLDELRAIRLGTQQIMEYLNPDSGSPTLPTVPSFMFTGRHMGGREADLIDLARSIRDDSSDNEGLN